MTIPETFLITACGRSGTKFLARELDRSLTWTVMHEPDTRILDARARFVGQAPCYGEVNSFLLSRLWVLDMAKKAVVLRDPYDIFRSYRQGGRSPDIQAYVLHAICQLDAYVHRGCPYFLFPYLTTDPAEVVRLAQAVGIHDLKPRTVSLEPYNANAKDLTREDAAKDLTGYVAREFDTFNRRYFPDLT